ncbi:MAG TPA: TIGR03089 family protein [Micromonosporaceae bacterium]
MNRAEDVSALLAAAMEIDPTRPLLTYYDDETDERTELSGATLLNWVAKTANMIVDDSGLGLGQRAGVGLPPHWQSAAVMLGCWSAGLVVDVGPEPADVAFVEASQATHGWPAVERYALGLHPLALPMRQIPDGYLDFNAEVRVHGDHFYPQTRVPAGADALIADGRTWTHADLIAEAGERATRLGITGGRVLIDGDAYPHVLDWLLTPLAGAASIVLCRHLDRAREGARSVSERVTQQLL